MISTSSSQEPRTLFAEDSYDYAAAAAADGETKGYEYYEYDGSNVEGDGD